MHMIEAAVAAFAAGVFMPGVCRKVKSYFAAEPKKLEAEVKAVVAVEVKKL
jgi:hypothetical protein